MRIKLTKTQVDAVEWALDPMQDYVADPDCDYSQADMPQLIDDELLIESRAATEDLIYRLRDQLGNMTDDLDSAERMRGLAYHRSACLLADKLEAVKNS